MTTIEPTHSSFDDAMEFFEMFDMDNAVVRADMVRTLRLVHGVCLSSEGIGYAHGWVEEAVEGDPDRATWPPHVVWQGMMHEGRRAYFAVERDWFYSAYRVKHRTAYRMEQFAAMNLSSGHYGPWLAKYRALMKGQGEARVLGRIEGASLLGMVFADGAEG
jgi:hypothetical protein